ncbi:MAG: hypothetical protein WB492_02870 [Christiangramia sp.]
MNRLYVIFLLSILFLTYSCNKDDSLNGNVETSRIAHLYVTTHNGEVKRYDINSGVVTNYNIGSTDLEGIFFSNTDDTFTVVSRSSGRLESYANISTLGSGGTIGVEATGLGPAGLESPRDLAVNGNFYVVSDNTDLDEDEVTPEGRIFVYTKNESGFTLRNVVTTKFKVWGLTFVGDDLYAAVDETNKIAVYRNFISTNTLNRIITADKIVGIQGLVRSHGMDFENGTMVLSDIGESESASDGGLHIIQDFESKFSDAVNGGFIEIDKQLRISGANTLLGNPVNLVYDSAYNVIFVAEALNNGGRIMAFNDATSVSGNISPDLKYDLPAASSVFFYTE